MFSSETNIWWQKNRQVASLIRISSEDDTQVNKFIKSTKM